MPTLVAASGAGREWHPAATVWALKGVLAGSGLDSEGTLGCPSGSRDLILTA